MLYNSQSCQIDIADGTMNYIEFGKGRQPLIILPGLSDGISPVHGQMQAIILASAYKKFARDFKVYIFSRKSKQETLINVKQLNISVIKEPDAKTQSR